MSDQLEEIKSKINIVDLIGESVPLKKMGRNFKGLCPFHNEKTPSFIVSPERQIFHCFGCQAGGDVFGFLMKMENIEFVEALRMLAKRAGVTLKSYIPTKEEGQKERLYGINHLASEFYHYILLNKSIGKRALDYLINRGISKKSIDLFMIGYAPNMWEGVSKFLLKKGYGVEELEQAGLIIKSPRGSYYDRFRGRVIFTLKDQRGNVVGFSARSMDPDAKEAKYINSPETPVYSKSNNLYGLDITKDAVKKENSAIITEGEIDLISSYQAGVKNVVAIKGSALTEGHVNLLKRYTENIVFALDSDFAGNSAAKRGIEIADNAGLNMKVVELLYGKDPDECVKKDPALWRESVKKAVPIYDYIINLSQKKYDPASPEGKKLISEDVIPLVGKITNEIVKSHYVKKLSLLLSVSEDAIVKELGRLIRQPERLGNPLPEGIAGNLPLIAKKTREELLEEYFLAFLFQSENLPDILQEISSQISSDDFLTPVFRKIYHLIEDDWEKDNKINLDKIVSEMPQELIPTVDRLFLLDSQSMNQTSQSYEDGVKIAIQIAKESTRRRLKAVIGKMKESQDETEAAKSNELFQKLRDRLKLLQNL